MYLLGSWEGDLSRESVQLKAILPIDVKEFLVREAQRYGSNQSSEIIRAVRERMDRVQAATGAKFGDQTPAAADRNAALQGGIPCHNGK